MRHQTRLPESSVINAAEFLNLAHDILGDLMNLADIKVTTPDRDQIPLLDAVRDVLDEFSARLESALDPNEF